MANKDQIYIRRQIESRRGFSHAVFVGDYLFISGTTSWDCACGKERDCWESQIETAYNEIGATLIIHGLDPGSIVRETIYTCDIDRLLSVNETRLAFYRDARAPASAFIECERLAGPDFLVKIEVIAFRNR